MEDDLIIYKGTERGDEVDGECVKCLDIRDIEQEVLAYKFFLWAPDLVPLFVEDCIKVRVLLSCLQTRQQSKEVGEEVKVNIVGFISGGGSNGGWAPNNVLGRWVAKGGSGGASG